MRVTTSQYERSGKNNAHLLSHNLPAGKKQFIALEQAAFVTSSIRILDVLV